MRKNTAGQHVGATMNAIADGDPITTGVTLVVTGDGTQSASGGTLAHKGNGVWDYIPTQAETNFNNVMYTFISALAPNQSVTYDTISYDPHDLANLGLTNLDALISSRMATFTYTAPDNTSITAILGDTNELQLNQGSWLTATGFNTVVPDNTTIADTNNILDALTELDSESNLRYTAKALENVVTLGTGVRGLYKFSTNTSATDPTSGKVKTDNANMSLVTELYLSETTDTNFFAAQIISTMKVGDKIMLTQEDDGSKFVFVTVSDTIIDNGGWYTIPVTVTDSGTQIANNKTTIFSLFAQTDSASTIATATRIEMDSNSTKLDVAVGSRMATFSYTTPPTAAAVADAVWDELIAGHVGAGSFGLMLDVPVSSVSGGGGITVQQVVDGVWDALISAHTDVGSFGSMLDVKTSSRMATFTYTAPDNTSIAAILLDTDELQINQGNWLTATGFSTVNPDNASITAILGDTNELQLNQGNWVTADVSGLMLASSYTAPPSVSSIADGVWDELIAGHVDAGSFGLMLDDKISSRMATFSYTAPDNTGISNNGTAIGNLTNFSAGDVTAIVDALENLSAADIKTQMVAALTDPNPEAAMPISGLAEQIAWLFARFAHKQEQTDILQTVNKADGTPISTAAISADGTTTTIAKHS